MSWFTDFVVASPDSAKAIAVADNPTEKWPGHTIKSVGLMDLGNLHSLVFGSGDPAELVGGFECLTGVEEGMVVCRLPETLVGQLASMKNSDMASVADRWAACEEFLGGWQPSELLDLIDKLRELATLANSTRQCLFMCMSG